MIVHNPRGLHMGVYDRGADKLEPPFFQIFADRVRQFRARGKLRKGRKFIVYRFSAGKAPDVFIECSEFFSDLDKSLSVCDCTLDLKPVPDDAGVFQQGAFFPAIVLGDLGKIEVVECLSEIFPLSQNGKPAQSRLEPLKDEEFEYFPVIVNRNPPFRIVVLEEKGIVRGPRTGLFFPFHD